MFFGEDVIAECDIATLKRYKIENQSMLPICRIQLIDEDGKDCSGLIFMRGKVLYMLTNNGIYYFK